MIAIFWAFALRCYTTGLLFMLLEWILELWLCNPVPVPEYGWLWMFEGCPVERCEWL